MFLKIDRISRRDSMKDLKIEKSCRLVKKYVNWTKIDERICRYIQLCPSCSQHVLISDTC